MRWLYVTCLGIKVANELARKDTDLSTKHTIIFCCIPLSACKHKVEKLLEQAQ